MLNIRVQFDVIAIVACNSKISIPPPSGSLVLIKGILSYQYSEGENKAFRLGKGKLQSKPFP